jgi:Ni/Fe-hydrogenase subunit HybB-like protein
MLILFLKSRGYMENVSREHLHDLGKFLFGLSVFWTYLWFDQFMLIWYANVGEETIYYKTRMTHYPVLFWGNLLMNFIAPFFILMRNDTKRKMGTIFIAAAICFFGHWWDFFYMIKPGARIAAHEAMEISHGGHGKHQEAAPISQAVPAGEKASADHSAGDHSAVAEASAGHGDAHGGEAHGEEAHGETGHGDSIHPFQLGFTIPGLTELGVMIGFLSLFLFFFFTQLQKASLLPKNDPFIEESMHHHTGVYPAGEEGGDHH